MKPEETYDGWTNCATGLVWQYLAEESDAYEYVRRLLRGNRASESLASALEAWMEKIVWQDAPLLEPIENLRRDLIGFSLERVDWRQIADQLLVMHPE